jgi:hypothetical protein
MTFASDAPLLQQQGYRVTPTRGKAAFLPAWQSHPITDDILKTHGECNTGIICGDVLAVDVDILNQEVIDAIYRAWKTEGHLDKFKRAPRRTGQAPKTLFVFRAAEPGMTKKAVKLLPPGEIKAQGIEVLATGQQFVAYGVHPDTNKPYKWNGAGEPRSLKPDDLPALSAEEVDGLLRIAYTVLCGHGWSTPTSQRTAGSSAILTRPKPVPLQVEGAPKQALDALAAADPDDRESWVAVGHALKQAERDGETWAEAAWLAWSQQSSKWRERDRRQWSSFHPTSTSISVLYKATGVSPFDAVDVSEPASKPSLARPLGDAEDFDFDVVYHLIDNVLPVGGLTMLWGESTAGKSFLALDWALHLVYGLPWHGHKVRPGRVFYMAGEGEVGLKKRVVAWRKHRNIAEPTGTRFAIHNLKHVTAFESLDMDAYSVPPCDLIVVDTLNRWSQGNENASDEMGHWLRIAQQLSDKAGGAAVLIVHHARKDGDQYRGSTAIKAAVDAEFEISGDQTHVLITHRKSKDEEMLPPMTLMKRVVQIGMKDDGFGGTKMHTSLVFEQPTDDEENNVADELADRIITALRRVHGECGSQNQLVELVKGKKALVHAKIKELIDRKVIERVGRYGLRLLVFSPVEPGTTPDGEDSIWD